MSSSRTISLQQPELCIQKLLASSKFRIFLATPSTSNEPLVIKAFPKNDYSRYFFIKEKKAHSSLNHPNIIQYIPDHLFQVQIPHFTVIFMEYAPYGDFFSLSLDYTFRDEKLIRTYFHQAVAGLQYLHASGIAHLDIKLENFLLGKDLSLKIADFDLAQKITDEHTISSGTTNYRAPEIWSASCKDYCAADIYSLGVCLYTFITGAFPFLEEGERGNERLFRYDTFEEKNEDFWCENQALLAGRANFSESFKELVNGMWKRNPIERMKLEDVVKSKWFNEPVYSDEEMRSEMKKVLMI